MQKSVKTGIALAVLAAALYALNAPLSKLLLSSLPPTLTAGFLYLGAGLGMGVLALFFKVQKTERTESRLSRKELPFVLAMIALDVAAPVFLMFGLSATTAENASLLNNFEIVATALIALLLFREKISPRLWTGIAFVTLSCALLSPENFSTFRLDHGSLLILAACVCWGLENNCTRKLSSKDPLQIVLLKGVFSGLCSVIIGFSVGEKITAEWSVFAALGVGFVAYGLSIFFYVYAQRRLGAARTSAYYAVAPFIGVTFSFALFHTLPNLPFYPALALMAIGAWLCAKDEPVFSRKKRKKQRDRAQTELSTDGSSVQTGNEPNDRAQPELSTDGSSVQTGNEPNDRATREQRELPSAKRNGRRNGRLSEKQDGRAAKMRKGKLSFPIWFCATDCGKPRFENQKKSRP